MTPKEKAIELVGKMCGNNCTETNINRMIKPTLIAVDELLNEYPSQCPIDSYEMERHLFWVKVKKEIEKL